MKRVYIVSQSFDPADSILSDLRDRLTTASMTPIVLAYNSEAGETTGEIVRLRARALAALMAGSQIVIAAIIVGYFSRFFPVAMTVLFWALVLTSIFIASRFGATLRENLLTVLAGWLTAITFAQKPPAAIWVLEPDTLILPQAKRHNALLVVDFIGGASTRLPAASQALLRQADLVIAGDGVIALGADEYPTDDQLVLPDRESAISALSARLI